MSQSQLVKHLDGYHRMSDPAFVDQASIRPASSEPLVIMAVPLLVKAQGFFPGLLPMSGWVTPPASRQVRPLSAKCW